MPALEIRLLGGLEIIYHGQQVVTLNQGRLQSLLAYLVLHRTTPQARQHVAFLFWPDTTETQALTNLRNLLHKLRQSLPESKRFLRTDMHSLQWCHEPDCVIDVVTFEDVVRQATTQSELEAVVQLYGGDLLPGCYEDWILPIRERLRWQAMEVLTRLVDLLEEQRRYQTALTYCQQLQHLDPLQETTYCRLMRLHAARGDRVSALAAYQSCVRILEEELAVPPSPSTRELYQRLLDSTPELPSYAEVTSALIPLVGRQSEWKALLDIWYKAASGIASFVLLNGESGIGKTRLAEELATWVQNHGFGAAVARCYAAEGALTYAPVVDWLRSPPLRRAIATLDPIWCREIARLLPELLTTQPSLPEALPITQGWQRQHLFEALARTVLSSDGPLLLWLDDLQWADRDTLEWLHYLLRVAAQANAQQRQPAQIVVLGTVRDEEVRSDHPLATLLAVLRQAGQLQELTLARLTSAETVVLATHLAGRMLPTEQLSQLHTASEGNPLFLVEMMHALEGSDAAMPTLTPRLHAVIQGRLARLSPQARELSGLAAAIGRAFTLEVVARAWAHDDESLVQCLDELWQRRIVREQSAARYDFTHDKLREVAYQSLSAARRRLLHRRVAEALVGEFESRLNEVSAQVALHYELAGLVDLAVPYYQRAAEVAQRLYANSEALQYGRRALALLKESGDAESQQAEHLHEQLGDLLHFTGQYTEARRAYRDAIHLIPALEHINGARLRRKNGNSLREQYDYQQALSAYLEARHLLEQIRPPLLDESMDTVPDSFTPDMQQRQDDVSLRTWGQEWLQVLLEIRMTYYWLGSVEDDAILARTMLPFLEQVGMPSQRADFYRMDANMAFRRNRNRATPATVSAVERALAVLREAHDQERIPSAFFLLGFHLLWSGKPQAGLAPFRSALQMAERNGDISLQARVLTYLALALRQCEQVDDAEQTAEQSKAVATLVPMPEYIATADANLAWVAWRRGAVAQTVSRARAALDQWHKLPQGHSSVLFQWTALWPILAVAIQREETASAIDHARAMLAPAQQQLSEPLAHLLERAVQAWDKGAIAIADDFLHQSVTLAQRLHYL